MDNFDIPLEPQAAAPGARIQVSSGFFAAVVNNLGNFPTSIKPWSILPDAGSVWVNIDHRGLSRPQPSHSSVPTTNHIQPAGPPIGLGDYPDTMQVVQIFDASMITLDGFIIDRNTTIRFYKEKNFQGGVVEELTGPRLINSIYASGFYPVNTPFTDEDHGWFPSNATTDEGELIRDIFPNGYETRNITSWPGVPEAIISVIPLNGSFKIRDSSQLVQPVNPEPEPELVRACDIRLTVSFTGIDHWTYEIDGRAPTRVGAGGTANITGLNPGTYVLTVKGLDAQGTELARDETHVTLPGSYSAPQRRSGQVSTWDLARPTDVATGTVIEFVDVHAKQRRVAGQEVWDWHQSDS